MPSGKNLLFSWSMAFVAHGMAQSHLQSARGFLKRAEHGAVGTVEVCFGLWLLSSRGLFFSFMFYHQIP